MTNDNYWTSSKVFFEKDGFSSITTAGSAQEAIVACHTSFPDLAILDVNLPDKDGFSLMKDIRQIKDIPILFLTAGTSPKICSRDWSAGGDDYMTKPFLPKELLLRLCAILRRSYKNEKTVIELAHCAIDLTRQK
ncbi:MAG: response regulator transcription factor [Butyricimonas faecihominis]